MKNESPQKLPPPDARQAAILKTTYKKDGVEIAFYNFGKSNIYALAFERQGKGVTVKGVFCDGRLRREQRRLVVKACLLAFKYDQLREMKIGNRKMRGVIFSVVKTEVKNA